jgi:hypothetical protein
MSLHVAAPFFSIRVQFNPLCVAAPRACRGPSSQTENAPRRRLTFKKIGRGPRVRA